METSKVDLTAELPYRVPVDFIQRVASSFIFLFGAGVVFMLAYTKVSLSFSWLFPVCFLFYGIILKFKSGSLLLDKDGIQHSAFFRKRNIRWSEINQVISGTQDSQFYGIPLKGSLGNVKPSMGPYLMMLIRKDGCDPFLLNIKPYSMRGVATLVHFLTVKAAQAKIDDKTLKMMNGIFPSIFFGEGKGYF